MLEKYLKNTRIRKQGLISFKIKRTYELDKQNLTIPSNVICAVYISGWYSAYMCLLTKRFFSPCSTFNWTVPFCSYLMCVIFTLGTVVLYLVPLKFLLLAWGKVFFPFTLECLILFYISQSLRAARCLFFALILLFFYAKIWSVNLNTPFRYPSFLFSVSSSCGP